MQTWVKEETSQWTKTTQSYQPQAWEEESLGWADTEHDEEWATQSHFISLQVSRCPSERQILPVRALQRTDRWWCSLVHLERMVVLPEDHYHEAAARWLQNGPHRGPQCYAAVLDQTWAHLRSFWLGYFWIHIFLGVKSSFFFSKNRNTVKLNFHLVTLSDPMWACTLSTGTCSDYCCVWVEKICMCWEKLIQPRWNVQSHGPLNGLKKHTLTGQQIV